MPNRQTSTQLAARFLGRYVFPYEIGVADQLAHAERLAVRAP